MSVLRLDKRTLSPAVPYGSSVPPLDFAPDAAAAYSLRLLRSAYTGSVVTVRRSTDDAELGFTATQVSNGDLASWCMGGDGFVKTWHDQSGNARDATQATAASQPKIVSSGVVVTEGGKAAVSFDGVDDYIATSSAVAFQNVAAFLVFRHNDGGDIWKRIVNAWSSALAAGWFLARYSNTNAIEFRLQTVAPDATLLIPDASLDDGEQLLLSAVYSQGAGSVSKNGAEEDSVDGLATSFNASQSISVGARFSAGSVTEACALTISELIIYPRDMTADRERIEGSMAWYY